MIIELNTSIPLINKHSAGALIQNEDGTWMQVLNEKSSYHEFSVTCMLGYALARGIRMGWLDPKFSESLNNAFDGIASRIDKTGKIKKVCVGTGVQNSLKEYLNRPAISGFDHRGGSLLLIYLITRFPKKFLIYHA